MASLMVTHNLKHAFETQDFSASPRLGSRKSPRLASCPSTPQLVWRPSPRKQSRYTTWLVAGAVALLCAVLLLAVTVRRRDLTSTAKRDRLLSMWQPLNGALDPVISPSLLANGHTFTPVDPKRVVVMQSDTRAFHNVSFEKPQEAEYWVSSAMANALWAIRHGYDYQRPVVPNWEGWHSTWPRMKAIRDLVAQHDWVVFFDSDAFVIQPELSLDDLRRRWGMHDQASFLASHDRWPNQIIAGFWIFRNTPTTLDMLDRMLECPEKVEGCERWKLDAYHEQSVFNIHLKHLYREGEELIVAPCVEAYGAPDYDVETDCQGTIIRHTGGPGKWQLPGQVAETMLRSLWELIGTAFNGTHLTIR